jgi:hypothetical protein
MLGRKDKESAGVGTCRPELRKTLATETLIAALVALG